MNWIIAAIIGFVLAWPCMFVLGTLARRKNGPTVTELTDACMVLLWEFHRTQRAENFCGWTGTMKDGRQFEISVQRINGKTPSMRIAELEAEIDALALRGGDA